VVEQWGRGGRSDPDHVRGRGIKDRPADRELQFVSGIRVQPAGSTCHDFLWRQRLAEQLYILGYTSRIKQVDFIFGPHVRRRSEEYQVQEHRGKDTSRDYSSCPGAWLRIHVASKVR
jgi:hypothetical protein